MRKYFYILAALLLVVAATSAFAEDLNPPSWRGQAGSTFGKWLFSTNSQTPSPEPGYIYPWGLPTVQVTPGFMQSWQDNWGGRQGVWPLSGEILVTIPNSPVNNPLKRIWVQLTWAMQAPNTGPSVTETRFNVGSTLLNSTSLGGGWYHSTYEILLQPNPDWEQILITGAVNVDELVIDTQCVPEPGSLMALGAGALGLIWRRRR